MTRLFAALIAALVYAPFALCTVLPMMWFLDTGRAQPIWRRRTDRARATAPALRMVNGFALGGSLVWKSRVGSLFARRRPNCCCGRYPTGRVIPRDSFIQLSDKFQQAIPGPGCECLEHSAESLRLTRRPERGGRLRRDYTDHPAPAGRTLTKKKPHCRNPRRYTGARPCQRPPKDETLSEARRRRSVNLDLTAT